jgi:hypothetical protein
MYPVTALHPSTPYVNAKAFGQVILAHEINRLLLQNPK